MICPECGFNCDNGSSTCPVCGYLFDNRSNTNNYAPVTEPGNIDTRVVEVQKNSPATPAKNVKPKKSKAPLIIIICLLLVVAVAVGIVFFIKNKKNDLDVQKTPTVETDSESNVNYEDIEDVEDETTDSEETDTNTSIEEDPYENSYTISPNVKDFYGVWCGGLMSFESDAVMIAEILVDEGYRPKIVLSGNWSNLGAYYAYLVTSGTYSTKAEAESALQNIKKYYPDAYVGYSGTFVEYTPPEVSEENEYDNISGLISLAQIRELTYSDLVGYSSFELSAIRNGIYAYHGYIFQSEDWQNYFSMNYSWYIPNMNFKTENLSALELKNATTIEKYEKETYGGVYKFN